MSARPRAGGRQPEHAASHASFDAMRKEVSHPQFGCLSRHEAVGMGSAPAPGAVARALAVHRRRRKRFTAWCVRTRPGPARGAPDGSRGGCDPHSFPLPRSGQSLASPEHPPGRRLRRRRSRRPSPLPGATTCLFGIRRTRTAPAPGPPTRSRAPTASRTSQKPNASSGWRPTWRKPGQTRSSEAAAQETSRGNRNDSL
jgi:hypothetical protein